MDEVVRCLGLPSLLLLLAITWQYTSAMMTPRERYQVSQLEKSIEMLTQQLMMLQLSQEEMRRSDGDSGIKQVRLSRDGTRPYHCNTHTGPSVASMHDHANMPRTCGMGELEVVLNGVHFRTRHNDYLLQMPSSKGDYQETLAIPFPAAPPAVLRQRNVTNQIAEMKEWFRAWRDGDTSIRDYRLYFKPILCYLEGAWSTDVTLQESFHSERHHLDASDLRDLQEKIRYTSYTGDKNIDENLAYLPTMILNFTYGVPVLAQWTYRILCHPLKEDLSPKQLKPVEELGSRLASKATWTDYVMSRAARFSLNSFAKDKIYRWTTLDKIMNQIPGKNGYGSWLTDRSMGDLKLQPQSDGPLNTAYYHRWYKLSQTGAMGDKVAHTGFNDRNLFVAETTQPRVAPLSIRSCRDFWPGRKTCRTYSKRVSYAIPLEVVYLTPLHAWNPYQLQYKGDNLSALGRTVTANNRQGKVTPQAAFNGTNSRHFYQTPAEFFQLARADGSDPADTVKGVVGVLDEHGTVRRVVASGVQIFLPEIKDLGVLRTRYPIMPVYAEGSTIWKELEALRDVVINMEDNDKYFPKRPHFLSRDEKVSVQRAVGSDNKGLRLTADSDNMAATLANIQLDPQVLGLQADPVDKVLTAASKLCHYNVREVTHRLTLVTSPSTHTLVTLHVHTVEVDGEQIHSMVKLGKEVTMRTTLGGGHSHLLVIGFDRTTQYFVVQACDGKAHCWDGHPGNLEKLLDSPLIPVPDILKPFG